MKVKKIILIITLIVTFILIFIFATLFGYNFVYKKIQNNKSKDTTDNLQHITYTYTGIDYNYKNPAVPYGFKKIETDTASWELDEEENAKGWKDGLVIEDDIGNQFVWIPYTTNNTPLHTSNESLAKYGGFYISRYEAGLPEELSDLKHNISEDTNNIKGIPVSKKGAIVWNYIDVNNAYYNAQNMYPENPYFRTEMLDTTASSMAFVFLPKTSQINYNIERNEFYFTGYYSVDNGKNYEYAENMKKTGQMLLSTGASEECKGKNVYDFYGNVADTHITSISKYGYKYAVSDGDSYNMNNEDYYDNTGFYHPRDYQGFRIALYIK